eukprot:707606-Prorocentrum_minimum.AAC.2
MDEPLPRNFREDVQHRVQQESLTEMFNSGTAPTLPEGLCRNKGCWLCGLQIEQVSKVGTGERRLTDTQHCRLCGLHIEK